MIKIIKSVMFHSTIKQRQIQLIYEARNPLSTRCQNFKKKQ